MKKALCLFFCLACVSAGSSASENTGFTDIDGFSFKHEDIDLKKASYEEIQGVFSSYGDNMSSVFGIDDYRTVEKGYLRLVYSVFPGLKTYWGDVYTYGDSKVVQADSLIDLQRSKVDTVKLGARMHDYTSQYSVRESDGAEYPELRTSHFRMKAGLAPIGPDNEPLIVCRLHDDPRASYYELAQHDAWRLLNALGTGMSLNQACMSEKVVPNYWRQRIDILIDGRGRITRSKRHLYDN